jgi:hypothetical protein
VPPVHSIGQACAKPASHGPGAQAVYDMQYAGFELGAAGREPGEAVHATHTDTATASSTILITS